MVDRSIGDVVILGSQAEPLLNIEEATALAEQEAVRNHWGALHASDTSESKLYDDLVESGVLGEVRVWVKNPDPMKFRYFFRIATEAAEPKIGCPGDIPGLLPESDDDLEDWSGGKHPYGGPCNHSRGGSLMA